MTKIMLVEDDNNLREIYQARLAAEGFDIVSSSDGEAALAQAAKERPDVIISDVMMPKISGFEMLDILRNTDGLKNVKVIMLTALGQAEDSQRANSLGADRYLVKSQVTLEDIVKATHELVGDAPETPPAAASTTEDTSAQDNATETPEVAETPAVETAPAMPTPEAIIEPVAVAPEAVVEPTPEEPAAEPVTVAPAPVIEPTTENVAPDPTSIGVTPEPSVASEPVAVTQEPAPEVAAPAMPEIPEPKPVTTIPVMEAPSDPSPTPANDDTDASAAAPALTDDSLDPLSPPITDLTSQDSSTVAEPVLATPPANDDALTVAADSQSTASEEASIKAQIDSFINNNDAGQQAPVTIDAPAAPESTPPLDISPLDAPDVITPQPAPSEEVMPASENLADSMVSPSAPATEPQNDVPAPALSAAPVTVESVPTPEGVVEPEPEVMSSFAPPVISSSDGTAAPAPTFMPTPSAPVAPASDPTAAHDDSLLADAAQNLTAAAPQPTSDQAAQVTTDTGKPTKKIIEPLSPLEPKTDIHQLLAVEEAKNAAGQAASITTPTPAPAPNVDAYTPVTPPQPAPKNDVDPNSISL